MEIDEQIHEMIEVEGLLPERVATLLNIPLEMVYDVLGQDDEDFYDIFQNYDEDIQ